MNDTTRTTYRVIQKGLTVNEPVTDFDSLVTHHRKVGVRVLFFLRPKKRRFGPCFKNVRRVIGYDD